MKKKSISDIEKIKLELKKNYPLMSKEESLLIDKFLKALPNDPKERYGYLVNFFNSLRDNV